MTCLSLALNYKKMYKTEISHLYKKRTLVFSGKRVYYGISESRIKKGDVTYDALR